MSEARAILGAGLVTLNLWNATTQAWSGFGEPLDADKFGIQPDYEEKTSTSKSHLDYGQARASVVLPKPTTLSMEIASASGAAMAMQFQGIVEAWTQAAATVTDEAVIAKLEKWVPLSKKNLSDANFVVTNTGASKTYVKGTDYEVNWARGEIRALEAGEITADEPLKVDFTAVAIDGTRILGGRNPQVRVQARFDGKNLVDGSPLLVDVWEAVLGSNNEFDFLSSDFNSIQLSGKIVTPAGKAQGYEILQG